MRELEDHRRKSEYELAEIITACITMFLFKEGSRNAFNNDRSEEKFKMNYQKLFKMKFPHMDTVDKVMRKLRETELEELKTGMVRALLNKKVFHKFRFAGHWFLVAVDATGVVSYSERHCPNCLEKTSKNGKKTYFHNVLEAKLICSNGFSISLATEWIENPDGDYDKQDCERKAFQRLAPELKKKYPRLPICITADGLYPNQTFFDICAENQWRFILTFKDGNLQSVWKKVNLRKAAGESDQDERQEINKGGLICQSFRWVNGIPYHKHELNHIECRETVSDRNGTEKKNNTFVHITDFEITKKNAFLISRAGRLRWKIENEGFDVQKNHGYNLSHKYSRTSLKAAKNYYQCLQIAHLINQLVELSAKCRELLAGKYTVCHLWKCLIGFMTYLSINENELISVLRNRIQIRFG